MTDLTNDLITVFRAGLPNDDMQALGELMEVVDFYTNSTEYPYLNRIRNKLGLKAEVQAIVARARERQLLRECFEAKP